MTKIVAAEHDRIALLDTLRGVVVLGIFFVNIVYFGVPYASQVPPEPWPPARCTPAVEEDDRAHSCLLSGQGRHHATQTRRQGPIAAHPVCSAECCFAKVK
jgi:hypothetical protein